MEHWWMGLGLIVMAVALISTLADHIRGIDHTVEWSDEDE